MAKNKMVTSEDFHSEKHIMNAKRYLPEVRVSFHTSAKCYQAKGRTISRGAQLDPTYQLLSVNTQKTLSNPAGAFTINLAGDQWEERLTSNDLVVISMGYVGGDMHTVMVGLIDRVKRRRTVSGGRPQITTTVTGRDFGKILLRSQLRFYPEIGANTNDPAKKFFLTDVGWIDMLSIFTDDEMVKGTPAVILEKIMTNILLKLNETEWSVYDESKTEPVVKKVGVGEVIRYSLEKTDFFLPFMLTADQFEGALWNLMERATQKPFTELFIDVRDDDESPVVKTVEKSSTNAVEKVTTTSTKTVTTKKQVDKYHTVVRGDTLWALAGRYYKRNLDWRKIWEANKAMMIKRDKRNSYMPGHWIYPGQKLRIPGITETVSSTEKQTTSSTTSKVIYPQGEQRFGYDNAKVLLTYRTTPFDSVDRNKLVKHTIPLVDVVEEDLERSDNEHYNLFWAGVTINPLGDLNLKAVMPPLINENDVKRYGISPLEVQIEGLEILREKEADHKGKLEAMSGKYSGLLKAWYENNHKYYNGSVTMRGRGNVRVGQRLIYEGLNKEFYIEGVAHTFTVFSDWTTQVTCTRGMADGEKVDSSKDVREPAKPPEPKKETPTKPKDESYTVKKGDTLWAIAGRFYKGKNTDWRRIWEANKDMLIKRDRRNASDHGHWIYPGQKLRIPK
jgi:nucleoid-associated protein YgaU